MYKRHTYCSDGEIFFFFKRIFLWKYTLACGMCFLKNPCITKDWQSFLNTLTGSEASSNCYLINIWLLSSQSHASFIQPLPVCPCRPAASGLRKRLTTTDCAAGWAFRLFWDGRPKQGGLSRENKWIVKGTNWSQNLLHLQTALRYDQKAKIKILFGIFFSFPNQGIFM